MPIADPGAPRGCMRGRTLGDERAGADVMECFWSDEPFRGWQAEAAGVTPYFRYLELAGF